jgi:hypothetical protein
MIIKNTLPSYHPAFTALRSKAGSRFRDGSLNCDRPIDCRFCKCLFNGMRLGVELCILCVLEQELHARWLLLRGEDVAPT